MCYDVSYMTRKAEKYAERYGDTDQWERMQQLTIPTFHVSGFKEPDVPVIYNDGSLRTLIWHPFAIRKGYNSLNARDDKLMTSNFWKEDFQERRCLVIIDGFFDWHDHKGVKYPFYVKMKSEEPFTIGAIFRTSKISGEVRETVTLVTTRANKEMAWIHNEPAYSPESRMMLVIEKEDTEEWLQGNAEEIMNKGMIKPIPDDILEYHPCTPIRSNKKLGRVYPGNVPEVREEFDYSVEGNDLNLFQ